MTNDEKTIKRLEYLAGMLSKYSHCWGESPSRRMQDWVDEYNTLRRENRPAFIACCDKHGWVHDHDAYDCMA